MDDDKITTDRKLELWKYFSDRSDYSANSLRAIILASANAGLAFSVVQFTQVADRGIVKFDVLLLLFIPAFLFGWSIWKTLDSWKNQKDKSINRRKDIANLVRAKRLFKQLEGIMEKGKANHEIDREATKFMLWGYASLIIVYGLWAGFPLLKKLIC